MNLIQYLYNKASSVAEPELEPEPLQFPYWIQSRIKMYNF
jgi:hypothetical protein